MAAIEIACRIEQLVCYTGNAFVPGPFRTQAYESLYLFINGLTRRVPAPQSFATVIKGDMIRVALQVCQKFVQMSSQCWETDTNGII